MPQREPLPKLGFPYEWIDKQGDYFCVPVLGWIIFVAIGDDQTKIDLTKVVDWLPSGERAAGISTLWFNNPTTDTRWIEGQSDPLTVKCAIHDLIAKHIPAKKRRNPGG